MVEENKKIMSSKGYLLFDTKKCAGCCSCMLACSLVHEGSSSFSLSRVQIFNDAFGSFPTDVEIAVCHQCDNPDCYLACPLKDEALRIDDKTGVRYIDESNCTGCRLCLKACRFNPSRIGFDSNRKTAVKCDLCQDTPFWDNRGKRACIEVCPVNAIQFTAEKPVGYAGYKINLRGEGWRMLGLPTD